MEKRSTWIVAAVGFSIVAILLTIAYAGQYATTNQATYLLDPLHRAMPELFHRDWFVSGPPYLPVYGWLAQWLYVIDPEGAVAVMTTHMVVMLATYAAIYWLVAAVGGGWRSFAIVASFATVTMGLSMSGSYLLVGYFQPSSLATLGWIVGMAALARDRHLTCGIAVAAAGALHANYLVLGVGLFGLAAFARRDLGLRDLAKIMGPQLVVLALFTPSLLGAAGPSKEAVWILTHFHAPVHYAPTRMTSWIKDILAWELGAYAGLYLLEGIKAARVMWRFSLVAFGVVAISALVIRYTPLESLTQVRWSRIGPFGQLACQVIIAAGLVRQAVTPRVLSLRARVLIAAAILVPLLLAGSRLHNLISWPAISVGAIGVLGVLTPWPQVARGAIGALAVLTFGYALWASPRGHGFTTDPYASPEELEVAHWVRANTPVDALFLVPPSEYRFRLLARRAVIADTKSPPLRPDLLVEWYHRVCAMVLYPDAPTFQAVEARYGELTAAQLQQVARSFGADYIMVNMNTPFPEAPVFHNAGFSIYRVAP